MGLRVRKRAKENGYKESLWNDKKKVLKLDVEMFVQL